MDPNQDFFPRLASFEPELGFVRKFRPVSINRPQGNDIALIRLPRLAVTVLEDDDEVVMPICLPWNPRCRMVLIPLRPLDNSSFSKDMISIESLKGKYIKALSAKPYFKKTRIFGSITMPTKEVIVSGWGRQNNNFGDTGDLLTHGAFSKVLQQLVQLFEYVLFNRG
jgi:hypothetical protein